MTTPNPKTDLQKSEPNLIGLTFGLVPFVFGEIGVETQDRSDVGKEAAA